jgi:ADP-ribose pyrophosphatase YjhB (NUDIX family)
MEKQFTATVYILEGDKALLLLHPKLQKWLPPGGHLEEGEIPPQCALREALEETGLEIELIKDEHIWVSRWNATSFERPWLCLLENIPPHNSSPAHQHIDFIYLGKPIGGAITDEHRNQHEIRWFTQDEILQLKPDEEIFMETQETLGTIFAKMGWTLSN